MERQQRWPIGLAHPSRRQTGTRHATELALQAESPARRRPLAQFAAFPAKDLRIPTSAGHTAAAARQDWQTHTNALRRLPRYSANRDAASSSSRSDRSPQPAAPLEKGPSAAAPLIQRSASRAPCQTSPPRAGSLGAHRPLLGKKQRHPSSRITPSPKNSERHPAGSPHASSPALLQAPHLPALPDPQRSTAPPAQHRPPPTRGDIDLMLSASAHTKSCRRREGHDLTGNASLQPHITAPFLICRTYSTLQFPHHVQWVAKITITS